jgi:molybdenum cofactor synthesis domain-containing protein
MEVAMIRVAILTVSDRGARGEAEDLSGPAVAQIVQEQLQAGSTQRQIVADEQALIEAALVAWADSGQIDLILTTGGTGFAPRDVTPEATQAVINRSAPGIAEAMRAASLQVTPHAMLSRAVAGMRGRTLIVNLPGSPKAVRENLAVILPVLPHAVELLQQGAQPVAYQHALPGEHGAT